MSPQKPAASCFVCKQPATQLSKIGDATRVNCPRCGEYTISGTEVATMRVLNVQERAIVSGWVRRHYGFGEDVFFRNDLTAFFLTRPKPSVMNRALWLLEYFARKSTFLGAPVQFDDPATLAISFSKDPSERRFLVDFLTEQGWLQKKEVDPVAWKVSAKGYLHVEDLGANRSSIQGFIAMWFHETMEMAYRTGLVPGIECAGYRPIRVDSVEHVNKIDDQIIAEIRKSRFLVADFTGQRSGVYFEAGFALGLDIPVIWTCHDSEITKLHFDIRQFNSIAWKTPEDLAIRLQRRIEAVIGRGQYFSERVNTTE